jgi:hypothetical protein
MSKRAALLALSLNRGELDAEALARLLALTGPGSVKTA